MIIGIGIDTIEINRFAHWQELKTEQLKRIFSAEEIMYCLHDKQKSSARFAARFAAREAFFKTLAHIVGTQKIPFLTLCKKIRVKNNKNGAPHLVVDWSYFCKQLTINSTDLNTFISLTHTKDSATAIVLLERE
jgi:holo-[acyl-carrier protein] synthase